MAGGWLNTECPLANDHASGSLYTVGIGEAALEVEGVLVADALVFFLGRVTSPIHASFGGCCAVLGGFFLLLAGVSLPFFTSPFESDDPTYALASGSGVGGGVLFHVLFLYSLCSFICHSVLTPGEDDKVVLLPIRADEHGLGMVLHLCVGTFHGDVFSTVVFEQFQLDVIVAFSDLTVRLVRV